MTLLSQTTFTILSLYYYNTLSCTLLCHNHPVTAAAIIVSYYLQQPALINMDYNGWDAVSAIKTNAIQAIFTWLICNGRNARGRITSSRMEKGAYQSEHMALFNRHIGFYGRMQSSTVMRSTGILLWLLGVSSAGTIALIRLRMMMDWMDWT
ncbi:predicted protein [Lichtheimia corymbifera JMRC:FSU:9682]|uniref:Uncharacterized protein n=1 Tax=Lichtheimia corymbifera JMRC:FSU:9682 TaxID=1263082 RepID=A0A068RQ00_9FUNG|nr:predicted protein [Lichtheimia corymbifera JMRC:FSU:9682]